MTRLSAVLARAIPLALVVLLCACAPLATQQPPAEQPAPSPSTEPEPRAEDDPPARPESESEPDAPKPPRPAEPEPIETSESTADAPRASEEPESPERNEEPASQPSQEAAEPEQEEPDPAPEPVRESREADPETTLTGRIMLAGGDADPAEAVVYFIPQAAEDIPTEKEPSQALEIVTRDKSLSPAVLSVSSGTEVRFPNEDPILHNLFSVSPENDFDLGVYGPGESPSATFEQPGVVNIYCNVHHDMHAHVLVVDTPWRTQPDADGNFRLTGLPHGAGELHIWHRQSDRWSRPIELPASTAIEATLEVTRPRLPPHRDKTGQSYNRRDRDPYR